ncbi:paraquat-inducible protein B [Solimonas aquatica]|uniref:Paraquat-inducible protein B n=1 Tax=Solimonas aquatica TaxID=489703 RepID=A0A1H9IH65_9GAMM|nr:MlaD family protein [Solimonas aquatica]SEQ73919.1 paraquat-inducible protein B [Solimonas aquatica]
MSEEPQAPLPLPGVERTRRWSLSLVWLVPLVATLAGVVLLVRAWLAAGPEIVIRFDSAEGLEAGKTELRYKDVVVGKVRRIQLSEDHQQVLVAVELSHDAASLAVEDSRFWVVRPRVGLGGVSGLNTLLSGAYIGVDVGRSHEERREFHGLEVPPAVTSDQKGRRYVLDAEDLGSLDIGSPLYFRRKLVGRVVAHQLRDDGRGVTLEVFVDAPFDRFVTVDTRFWNASGVDVAVGADGVKIDTEALATVLVGGIAFEAPPHDAPAAAASEKYHFALFDTRVAALAPPDGPPVDVRMRFARSMRGLNLGATVDFGGVTLGKVTALALEQNAKDRSLLAVVDARLYPQRLGELYRQQGTADGAAYLRKLVERGLRAQLQPGNLLTGQLFVSLDFVRGARPVTLASAAARPLEIPTVPGNFDQIQQQIADIVARLNKVPFDEIGAHLNASLASSEHLLSQLDTQLAPEAQAALRSAHAAVDNLNQNFAAGESPLQRNTQAMLAAVEQMARAMRELAEYLKRHPESLVFGKPDNKEPAENGKTEPAP